MQTNRNVYMGRNKVRQLCSLVRRACSQSVQSRSTWRELFCARDQLPLCITGSTSWGRLSWVHAMWTGLWSVYLGTRSVHIWHELRCRRDAEDVSLSRGRLAGSRTFPTPLLFSGLPSLLWHSWLGVSKSIRPVNIEWWGVDVVICLEWGADCLHMVQLMPLHPKTPSSLASFKCRLVLPFWYRLTQVVLEKRPLNECSCGNSSLGWDDSYTPCATGGLATNWKTGSKKVAYSSSFTLILWLWFKTWIRHFRPTSLRWTSAQLRRGCNAADVSYTQSRVCRSTLPRPTYESFFWASK